MNELLGKDNGNFDHMMAGEKTVDELIKYLGIIIIIAIRCHD